MTASLPFYSAEEVHRWLDYVSLVERLRLAFAQGAESPVRHAHSVGPAGSANVLLLMPAWRTGEAIGVKIVTVFPANNQRGADTVGATYLLLDGATGHPLAVLDGEALTLRRTGAASALASDYLSRPESRVLLVVGTGRLAPYMAAAHRAVRPIERVLVWGRRPERAASLAAQLRSTGVPAEPATELAHAASEADIVTCATTSTEPLLKAGVIRPGTHVDLVGGFTPQMREADDALMASARLFVDTFAGALKEAGDLVQPIERGLIGREAVLADLAMLARGEHRGRVAPEEITLFKSVGAALEDLAAACLAIERARSCVKWPK
jgi:ornithine cyclodeaminase